MKQYSKAILVACVLSAVPSAWAVHHPSHPAGTADAKAEGEGQFTEGEVRKVDKDAGKVTLRHGAIPNLDMPAMTMVFRVTDAGLLDTLKEGEKIRFRAEKVGGAFTLTEVIR